MTLTFSNLMSMVLRTIKNPREGAAEVLALGIPKAALWTIMLLVVVLSSFLSLITTLMVGAMGGQVPQGIFGNPITLGAMQFALLIVTVFAIFWIGRMFGGTGSLEESMLLVAWLQFVMVCLQVIQTLFFAIMPPIASLLGVLGLVLFLWLLTNFIAVLHGFKSLGQVFVMTMLSIFTIIFAVSLLLIFLGIEVQVPSGDV